MLPRNGAEGSLDFHDLEDEEPSFLSTGGLQVERANSDLLVCNIIVHRNLEDVFETALDVGHNRRVRASGGCRLRTGRGSYGMHCAEVP